MPKFLSKLTPNKQKINFNFKWFQHQKVASQWLAVVESEPLTLDFIDKLINGMQAQTSQTIITDDWIKKARIGESKKVDLTGEMKHSILLALPNCPPKGKKLLTKELVEMNIKKVEKGIVLEIGLKAVVEL